MLVLKSWPEESRQICKSLLDFSLYPLTNRSFVSLAFLELKTKLRQFHFLLLLLNSQPQLYFLGMEMLVINKLLSRLAL